MKNIIRTIALGILFTLSLGGAQSALAASEVQGTLSSDGSSGPAKHQEAVTISGNAGGGNSITGTVVGGVESDDRSVAAAGSIDTGAMMGLMWWTIPLSLVVLAGAGLYFFSRRI